jgi:hypothetical protein
MWFDATEESKDLEDALPFERLRDLKNLLFNIHKNENDKVNVVELINVLTVSTYNRSKDTYFKVLFEF